MKFFYLECANQNSKCANFLPFTLFCQVAGAEALVIRVVSSVDKKLEVKQRFLEIFQEENYPTEFPYKSKVCRMYIKLMFFHIVDKDLNYELKIVFFVSR